METAPLKSFATWARTTLIGEVSARLAVVLAPGSSERVEHPNAVADLERAIKAAGGDEAGRAAVAEKVAYTWFNRIIALRFMDANGFTGGVGVVSPERGKTSGQPEVLTDAKRGTFDTDVVRPATVQAVGALLDGTRRSADPQGEAFALLLAEYCRYWHRAMPFMFEREGDYTELLIPSNLLADDSVMSRAVGVLTEEVCADVEVIGWLYQFYISERKDEVFAGFKKNKKAGAAEIPAATQLFTPHWIVRYLVENSVGRLWLLNRPGSRLAEQMDYYIDAGRGQSELARSAEAKEDVDERSEEHIAPVDEETDFLRIEGPEELTVMDPACGSGHMLTYAFDLLYAIYKEEGYAPSDIPGLILEKNLFGVEIDPRAGALAAFALTMKARARQRTFFSKGVAPNVCVLEPISFTDDEIDFLLTPGGDRAEEAKFWNQFEHADVFGSLIQPDPDLTVRLARHLGTLEYAGDMLISEALDGARIAIRQAEYLSPTYSVVVANPPYMGSKQMNGLLSQFMKDMYPDSKSDLFAAFIERCTDFAGTRGAVAMITMQSWMFLSSFEKLRASLLARQRIASMLHLGARAFDSIGGEVVSSTAFVLSNVPPESRGSALARPGTFIRLVDGMSEAEKVAMLRTALTARNKDAGFHLASDTDFAVIPGSPIVYWLSEKMRAVFTRFQRVGATVRPVQGLATADDSRFLRQWWEVPVSHFETRSESSSEAAASNCRWFPFTKGGGYRRWYGNNEFAVNWEQSGHELNEFRPRSVIRNSDVYFIPATTWGLITSAEPSFRYLPRGFVLGHKGPAIPSQAAATPMQVQAILNSASASRLIEVLSPGLGLEVGQLSNLPVPTWGAADSVSASTLTDIARMDWDESETSWDFAGNALVALQSEAGA